MDMWDLNDAVAVVTGASSGLGARFARVLAGRGARVMLGARRAERLHDLVDELGADRAAAVETDVIDEAAVRRLVDGAVARFGRLDVLVNNAGIANVAPAEVDTTASFRSVIEVNLVGLFTCCREAARVMLPQGSGSIVNVASVLGLQASARIPQASYCASKGGVLNLTRELAAQWAGRGVRVNAIAPGWFPSEMTREMFETESGLRYMRRVVPMGRPGMPDELDGALVFLAARASSYVTGQALIVDGGWSVV
jgi:NAD(P)-dependent dehydrogenase (short-subunit alcohol dehydrogenase family)